MKSRAANKVQTKLVTLIYGDTFTGKTTLGLQFAYFKRPDGKPFRLMVIDAEGGGVDNALDDLADAGVNMENIHVFYTQSLQEVSQILEKIKKREQFYEYDEDGEETDELIVDADGEPFFPDALLIDGTSVLRLTSEQGLLELSKKRNKVKADQQQLTGIERTVKIQGASLEFKDYQSLNFSGQQLVLDLMAIGINVVITAREKDEKVQKLDNSGMNTSISTGRKIPDSFKGIDYNAKTILRTYFDESGQICAVVEKDRTKTFPAGTILEDPTLLSWQPVIDKNKDKQEYILKNDLNHAVETEQQMYEKQAMSLINEDEKSKKGGSDSEDASKLDDLKKEIKSKMSKLAPPDKQKMKETLQSKNLPLRYKDVKSEEVLMNVLSAYDELFNQ